LNGLHILGAVLAGVSFVLLMWQWLVAKRFPLHRRGEGGAFPGMTVFKPLKGFEAPVEECLRSWLTQEYDGPVQFIFAVGGAEDPVCPVLRKLLLNHPGIDAQVVVAEETSGANGKMAKLAAVQHLARHDLWVVGDADVWAPPDLLRNMAQCLGKPGVGLVNCFYRLAGAANTAMRWEAVAVNADFWSQVLQSNSLKPMDFALGAVMAVQRRAIEAVGGFAAFKDCLADDYQLGNRVARHGRQVELCPVVVECRSAPLGWAEVWRHQERWARTVRVCQPLPYFFSLLGNPTLWPLLWWAAHPVWWVALAAGGISLTRIGLGLDLMRRFEQAPVRWSWACLFPMKDLLQAALWVAAFTGNTVVWGGQKLILLPDGTIRRGAASSK
jgi:ceramide glucosyltransferase